MTKIHRGLGIAALSLAALSFAVIPQNARAQNDPPASDSGAVGDAPGAPGIPSTLVSLNVDNADLYSVLRLLFAQIKADFTLAPSLRSIPVTVSVNKKPFRVALEAVLSNAPNLTYKYQDGVFKIVPKFDNTNGGPGGYGQNGGPGSYGQGNGPFGQGGGYNQGGGGYNRGARNNGGYGSDTIFPGGSDSGIGGDDTSGGSKKKKTAVARIYINNDIYDIATALGIQIVRPKTAQEQLQEAGATVGGMLGGGYGNGFGGGGGGGFGGNSGFGGGGFGGNSGFGGGGFGGNSGFGGGGFGGNSGGFGRSGGFGGSSGGFGGGFRGF